MKLSRRNFNLGLLGAAAAAFCPSKLRPDDPTQTALLDDSEEEEDFQAYGGLLSNSIVLQGRVAMQPQLRSYARKDGSTGYRVSFPAEVTGSSGKVQSVSVVAWGEQAQQIARFVSVGDEVQIAGEILCDISADGRGFWHVCSDTCKKVS